MRDRRSKDEEKVSEMRDQLLKVQSIADRFKKENLQLREKLDQQFCKHARDVDKIVSNFESERFFLAQKIESLRKESLQAQKILVDMMQEREKQGQALNIEESVINFESALRFEDKMSVEGWECHPSTLILSSNLNPEPEEYDVAAAARSLQKNIAESLFSDNAKTTVRHARRWPRQASENINFDTCVSERRLSTESLLLYESLSESARRKVRRSFRHTIRDHDDDIDRHFLRFACITKWGLDRQRHEHPEEFGVLKRLNQFLRRKIITLIP